MGRKKLSTQTTSIAHLKILRKWRAKMPSTVLRVILMPVITLLMIVKTKTMKMTMMKMISFRSHADLWHLLMLLLLNLTCKMPQTNKCQSSVSQQLLPTTKDTMFLHFAQCFSIWTRLSATLREIDAILKQVMMKTWTSKRERTLSFISSQPSLRII